MTSDENKICEGNSVYARVCACTHILICVGKNQNKEYR